MAPKPKARSPARPKQKKPVEKSQRARFIETARSVGVDETGKEFEAAIKRIATARRRPRDS